MIAFIEIVFSSFWHWLGFFILFAVLMNGLSSIAAQLRRDDNE